MSYHELKTISDDAKSAIATLDIDATVSCALVEQAPLSERTDLE